MISPTSASIELATSRHHQGHTECPLASWCLPKKCLANAFSSSGIWYTGWWFGTFFHILGMSSSQLTSIFFRGVETTNQYKHVSGRVAGVLLFRSVENYPFLRRRQLGLMVCPFCWATPRCCPAHDERAFFCHTMDHYVSHLSDIYGSCLSMLFSRCPKLVSKKVDVSLFHPSLPDYKHMLTSLDFFVQI